MINLIKFLTENRRTMEKGKSPSEKAASRDKEAGVDGTYWRMRAKKLSKKNKNQPTVNPYNPSDKTPAKHAYTRGELHKNDPKTAKKSLAAHLAFTATSPKVKDRARKKLLATDNTIIDIVANKLNETSHKMKPIEPVKGKPKWKKVDDAMDKLKNPKRKPKYKKPKHDPLESAWKDVAKKKFEPKD